MAEEHGGALAQQALVSFHDGHCNKTPGDQFGRIEAASPWRPATLSFSELIAHISAGKAWCACKLDGPRSSASFAASNLIVLDVDGDLTLEAFWAIPMAARHCVFTYTSCSHLNPAKQAERNSSTSHSFRAVFLAEPITAPGEEGVALHGERYYLLVEQLGLTLADSSPAKPAQLWFGNDQAQIRTGGGEPLGWEFSADAAERLAAKRQGRAQLQAAAALPDDPLDEARAVYVLDHLLPPSSDGEYDSYWLPVLNAAAASGSERVREAFLDWHYRGHHGSTQKRVEKRYERAGNRSGLAKLFSLAKDRCGSDWYRLLPQELRKQGQAAPPPPIALLSSRSRDDIAPQAGLADAVIPDAVSPAALQRITFNLNSVAVAGSPQQVEAAAAIKLHDDLLWRIYRLEVELIHQHDGLEEAVNEQEAEALLVEYRNELYHLMDIYARESWRIDQALLRLFRQEHRLGGRSKRELKAERLNDCIEPVTTWLLPGLMAPGRNYLLYAKAGMGKTTMALMIARAVTGTPDHNTFLDCDPVPTSAWGQRRVLYIASDGGEGAIGDLQTYARWHQMDQAQWCEDHLRVVGQSSGNNSTSWKMNLYEMHRLAEILDEAAAAGTPYALIIFDSLKAICPRNVRVGDQIITDYLEILQELCSARNVASLIIHHQAKDNEYFQGASGISEIISGIFAIKDRNEQRCFCIEKTRVDRRGNRDLPYTIQNGRLVLLSSGGHQDSNSDEAKILAILQEHYDRHRQRVVHLEKTDEQRRYAGISRDDLRIALSQRGGNGKRIHVKKQRNDLLTALVNDNQIREFKYKFQSRYAIASAPSFCSDTQECLELDSEDDVTYPGWD